MPNLYKQMKALSTTIGVVKELKNSVSAGRFFFGRFGVVRIGGGQLLFRRLAVPAVDDLDVVFPVDEQTLFFHESASAWVSVDQFVMGSWGLAVRSGGPGTAIFPLIAVSALFDGRLRGFSLPHGNPYRLP